MAGTLYEFYQHKGGEYLEAALQGIVGRTAEYAVEEALFRLSVIEPGWNNVPELQRQLGRLTLRWDEILLALRRDVYDVHANRLVLRSDARQRIGNVLIQLFADTRRPQTVSVAAGNAAHTATQSARLPSAPTATAVQRPSAAVTAAPTRTAPSTVAVAIDFGSVATRSAYLDAQGRPATMLGPTGEVLTPSVVFFDAEGIRVGREAVTAAAVDPEKAADLIKRDLGGKSYRRPVSGWDLPPEAIAAFILRSVKTDIEQRLGPTSKVVLTVPALFDERRRRAMRVAAQLVDLEVLDFINEPAAAVLAYAHQHGQLDRHRTPGERPMRSLVFELGGGMFAASIVEVLGSTFKIVAADGDPNLGGRDWDEKLATIAAERIARETGVDPRAHVVNRQELLQAAETTKRLLSERTRATVAVNHAGWRLKADVSRQEFENATAPLLARTRKLAEQVALHARLDWSHIDRTILVGGSTRMPMVARMIEELTGRPPDASLAPEEAVAQGAALYAGMLLRRQAVGGPPRFSVGNVSLHSLGIIGVDAKTGQRRNQVLIARNTLLPSTVVMACRTARVNQRRITVWLVEGESERLEDCFPVGTCTIGDLPPNLPAGWPVHVSYTYEANRQIVLQARVDGYAASVPATFQRDRNPPADAVQRWQDYLAREGMRR